MTMRNVLGTICLCGGTSLFILVILLAWANTPEVFRVVHSNECVAIWTPQHGLTECGRQPLPARYTETLVSPVMTYQQLTRYYQ